MDIEVIANTEHLLEVRDAWESLEAADPNASCYISHRFVTAWWRAYCDDPSYALHTLVVRHNGEVVAIAPLVIRHTKTQGWETRVLRWASHGDDLGVLADPESVSATSRALVSAMHDSRGWDRISLTNMRTDSPFAHYLLRSEHNSSFKPYVECPYIDLRDYEDFDDFCARSLPAHTRKYRNKFLREHTMRFTVTHGGGADLLQRIGEVHQAERDFLRRDRDRAERHSLFADPRRVAHLRELYEGASDTVTFTYEDSSGLIGGYRTCFVQGRTLLSWNSAYAPAMQSYRLGKVLQYDILAHAFDQGYVDVFDFGAGRYPWKFEWTQRFYSTYRYRHSLSQPPKADTTSSTETARLPKSVPPALLPVSPEPKVATAPWAPQGMVRRTARAMGARRAQHTIGAINDFLTGRRQPPVIWYVPHPDDETIFMGASIASRRDRRHLIVLLTDGGESSALRKVNARLLVPISREDFMAARLREFTAAVTILGIRRGDVSRAMLPDGAIRAEDVLETVKTKASEHPGAEHRTMSYLDPHSDHAAAGDALRRAHEQGVVNQCFFHLPVPKVEAPANTRSPLSVRAVELKRQALDAYQVWDPRRARYGIGALSVAPLIEAQRLQPREHAHGPTFRRSDLSG